jgi:Rhodopirellula transposase DDE domain
MARAPSQGRRPPAHGRAVAPGRQGHPPQAEPSDRRHLRPQQKQDEPAVSSGRGQRVRLAGKAPVQMGASARGGLTRGDHQARAPERGGKEQDGPWGSVDEESAARHRPLGRSSKTRDGLVETIAAKGHAREEQAQAAPSLSQITLDNGPESRGRRTPCRPRLGQLADALQTPMPRRDDPPSHRTYHPIERWWGIVEWQGKGTQRIEAQTRLEWAKKRPWKGLHPVGERSRTVYQKGSALGKAAMQAVEARLQRHPAWPKYDIVMNPAPTS